MEEYSYTPTHPVGHNWACKGNTLLLPFYKWYTYSTLRISLLIEPLGLALRGEKCILPSIMV